MEPCNNRLPKMFHARGQNLDAKPLAVFVDDDPGKKIALGIDEAKRGGFNVFEKPLA